MQERHKKSDPRPYIGVLFDCCGIYQRVYRRADSSAYRARCPRCFRPLLVKVEEGGSRQRFFRCR